jgi:glutathione S-transferase
MQGDMGERNETPILWHLKVSNYNEKARWALDYKGIPHLRRALVPGRHAKLARKLTGESTFPVLVLDGEAIGDSTRIIDALERRRPDPPLYPPDPTQCRKALELEEFFDEELGPYARLLALHRMLPDAGLLLSTFTPDLQGGRRVAARAMYPLIRRRVRADFGIDERSVTQAEGKCRAACERFRTERGSRSYLVGDRFTVADLTLAALVAPLVAPEQFPYPQPQRGHPRLADVRDLLEEHGAAEWTREIYARHRGESAEVRPSA